MGQHNHKTAKLPQHLLDELGIQAGSPSSKSIPLSRLGARKAGRKAARVQKRSNSAADKFLRKGARTTIQKENQTLPPAQPVPKSVKPEVLKPSKSILKSTKSRTPDTSKTAEDFDLSSSPIASSRQSKRLKDPLAVDDAEIAALEKALGLENTKKLPKSFADDGLDTLLEGLNPTSSDDEVPSGSKRQRKAEEDWLRAKRLKATVSGLGNAENIAGSPVPGSHEEEVSQSDFGDNSTGSGEISGAQDYFEDFDEETSGDEKSFESLDGSTSSADPPAKVRENPYVAPAVESDLTAPRKYLPPSKRDPGKDVSGENSKLRRQMQGLLNRLSESNLLSILKDVEELYRMHPRQSVTSTLINLLINLLCDPTSLQDTFVILHAGFIAAAYRVVGSDFGGQTLSRIDDEIRELYQSRGQEEATGKKLTNMVNLLAQLFNFRVVGSSLIYDLIRLFVEELSEINAELLLKIVRSSGSQLRKEDAASLKAINQLLQSSMSKMSPEHVSVRTSFMVETVDSLANKGMKTGKAESLINAEHTSRIRSTLGSLNERSIRASEPLNIRLRDLRESEKRGKWWVVGASYRDNDQTQDHDDAPKKSPLSHRKSAHSEATNRENLDLLQLARQLGLNTDIRRSIFVTLVSGNDFETTCDQLRKLPLNASQRSEIPRVLIRCSGAQDQYNPYYTLVARRLILHEPKLKKTFQFSLWDLLDRIREDVFDTEEPDQFVEDESLELKGLINHARMFGNLIAEDGLTIAVLKNVNFTYLSEKLRYFAELLLITVILCSQEGVETGRNERPLMEIFLHAKDNPDLAQGLRYFLKQVVSKTDIAGSREETATVRWGCKVGRDVLKAIPFSTTS